ncbi:MAG TPA: immunoglobulin domain-containing protein [Candidatus Binatia bacterium]|nr:immunoglobulin domain-containing protein [Candidatus Binatia bacterium]
MSFFAAEKFLAGGCGAICLLSMAGGAWGATSKPAAPGNLAGSAVAPGRIQLTWNDNSSNETQFYLDRTSNNFGSIVQFVLGAKATNHLDTNLLAGSTYAYRVRAYNSAGYSAYSNTNRATTWSAPSIVQPPQSQAVAAGSNLVFTVTAAGTAPLSYQWLFNSSAISGATGTSLALVSVQASNAGNYTVVVSNAVAAVTSSVASLTVLLVSPGIAVQPASLSVVAGTQADLSVVASGTLPLSYQWQRDGTNVVDGGTILGAGSSALRLSDVQTNQAGDYRAVASNSAGTVTSQVARLTVTLAPAAPTVLSQPVAQVVATGGNAAFNVTAMGTSPLNYQWRCNGTNLAEGGQFSGTVEPALNIANAQPGNGGAYSVVVANPYGAVTSQVAALAVQLSQPRSVDLLVLINSRSGRYPDFQHYLQPYLDNFGCPYTVLDIATNSLGPEVSNHAVIIIGHSQLDTNLTCLGSAAQSNIATAVSNGVGLINFDNNLAGSGNQPRYQFVQQIFGFGYGTTTPVLNVTLPATEPQGQMHFITALHGAGDVVTLRSNLSLPSLALPAGVTGVAMAGGQPFLAIGKHGQGHAVQWGSYDWMSTAVLGPVEGLDDLLWRSIVWAARKPFVMRGLPNLVTMRMDDVSGPFWWVRVANQIGFKPWMSVFLNSIDETEAADLRNLVTNGLATTSIHAFDCCNTFFYFDHGHGTACSDTVISNNFYQGTQWHLSHGIPISKVVGPHYSEIGANAFPWLKAWGVEFVPIEIVPGTVEYGSAPAAWLVGGPYRLYETPQPGKVNWPLWYADSLSVPGHPELDGQFLNCYSEVRDDASCHEWCPAHNDVAGSIGRGTRQVKRELDSMVMGTLYTHEWYLIPIPQSSNQTPMTTNDWVAVLQGITNNLAACSPRYVTLDYANQYVRATRTSRISAAIYDAFSGQTTVTLSGKTDLETEFYLFEGQANNISNSLVSVPAFSGTNITTTTGAPVPPLILIGPSSLTNGAGSTARFSVSAVGTPPLSYQWLENGLEVGDATNPTLTLANISATDAASYSVVVSNSVGTAASASASLLVLERPTLEAASYSPETGFFTVTVTGSAGFRYGLQATTNFTDWVGLVTNVAPYIFTDTETAGLSARFYRGVYIP